MDGEMNALRIAVLTTDVKLYDFLDKTIADYCSKKCLTAQVTIAKNFKQFLPVEDENDILFLDDKFEHRTSIEVARLIRTKNPAVAIVIISSQPDKVYDCFEVNAHRFYVKPITQTMVFEALDAYYKSRSSYRMVICRIGGIYRTYPAENIHYVEANGKTCILHMQNHDVLTSNTYSHIVTQLPPDVFFQVKRGFCVNLRQVQSFTAESVILYSGATLPLSRRAKINFPTAYNTYIRSHTFS